jgi:hypothetical protein
MPMVLASLTGAVIFIFALEMSMRDEGVRLTWAHRAWLYPFSWGCFYSMFWFGRFTI